jgi:hypothetical protein
MRTSRTISLVALLTSAIIATDYGLAPIPNVKLMDTLVFSSAYVFGFRIGAYVAIFSEFVWSVVSPVGVAGYITPFLVGGELLFAFAGFLASKIWGNPKDLKAFSVQNSFFGATLAICAFLWDVETNIATGLLEGANTLTKLLVVEMYGIWFMLPHELSDFVFGSVLAPIVIVYFFRVFGEKTLEIPTKTTGQIPNEGAGAN